MSNIEKINNICNNCHLCENLVKKMTFERKVNIWCYNENQFSKNLYQILFVGKVARKKKQDDFNEKYIKNLYNCRYPFWNYTKCIVEDKLKLNYNDIAITNLIKCDSIPFDNITKDCTSNEIAENCLLKQKIFFQEINIIKPKHIIFYTPNYNDYLNKLFGKNIFDRIDFKYENYKTICSQFILKYDNNICHCLYFLHPQGKNKKISLIWYQNILKMKLLIKRIG